MSSGRCERHNDRDVRIACVIYKLQGVDIDAFAMFYQTLLRFIGDIHLILRIGLRRALAFSLNDARF